jgi:hypothetical protein
MWNIPFINKHFTEKVSIYPIHSTAVLMCKRLYLLCLVIPGMTALVLEKNLQNLYELTHIY